MTSKVSCSLDGPSDSVGIMNAYPESLRKKRVEAPRRGTGKGEAARLSGVSLSSVKPLQNLARKSLHSCFMRSGLQRSL